MRLAAQPLIRPGHSPSKDGRLSTPYRPATFSPREKRARAVQDGVNAVAHKGGGRRVPVSFAKIGQRPAPNSQ
jgi:hypothetical protein